MFVVPSIRWRAMLTRSHTKQGATPTRVKTPALLIGQHNEVVFAGLLGITGERLASLRAAGLV